MLSVPSSVRGQSTLSKWAAFVDTLEVTTLRYHDCLEPYSSGCHWWAIAVPDILTSLGRSLRPGRVVRHRDSSPSYTRRHDPERKLEGVEAAQRHTHLRGAPQR